MKRSNRREMAKETTEIFERGSYVAPSGEVVDFGDRLRACLAGTRYLPPDETERIAATERRRAFAPAATEPTRAFVPAETVVEVVNESTLAGIACLAAAGAERIGALNFASAKNPGGGFLNGSEAQEESLARSSALYASLQKAWEFYEGHRASGSLLYSHALIVSPNCPIFRDDAGTLLERPRFATFLSSPAPNAGAAAKTRPDEVPHIAETFRERTERLFSVAAAEGLDHLVLGAWGCGVFRNDPLLVARVFAAALRSARWAGRFRRVRFSVLDHAPGAETFAAFHAEWGASA